MGNWVKTWVLFILFSSLSQMSFGQQCHKLFDEPTIYKTYLDDLKGSRKLDPSFVNRFKLQKNTKNSKIAVQNYPYPQGKEIITDLLSSLHKQVKHIQENPSEYATYDKDVLDMKYFERVIQSGEALLKNNEFNSYDSFLFFDRALRLSEILPKSYIEKENQSIEDQNLYSMAIKDDKDTVEKNLSKDTLGMYFWTKKSNSYLAIALHPAILHPAFNYGRPFTFKEFFESYASGGFLMSIIPNKISEYDGQYGGPYEFMVHDIGHFIRHQDALKKYLREEFRKLKMPLNKESSNKKIVEISIKYSEARNQYISAMIDYAENSLSKKDAEFFYEYMYYIIHEGNYILTPELVMTWKKLKVPGIYPKADENKPLKDLYKFTEKFLKEVSSNGT